MLDARRGKGRRRGLGWGFIGGRLWRTRKGERGKAITCRTGAVAYHPDSAINGGEKRKEALGNGRKERKGDGD